jgi:hypothetical protein
MWSRVSFVANQEQRWPQKEEQLLDVGMPAV